MRQLPIYIYIHTHTQGMLFLFSWFYLLTLGMEFKICVYCCFLKLIFPCYGLCFKVDMETVNTTILGRVFQYSFNRYSCVEMHHGLYQIPIEYYKTLYDFRIPVIINESQKHCQGFIIIAKDIADLKINLLRLRKFYTDRVLCYIYDNDSKLLQFLKIKVDLFSDAEVIVSSMNYLYKLNTVEKKFYPLYILNDAEKLGKQKNILNFQGRKITVTTFNNSIFTKVGPLNKSGHPEWTKGLDLVTFSMLAKLMNVSWRVSIPTEEHKWGYKLPNGNWSGGIFKKLIEKKADIGMACIWLTQEKYESFPLSVARMQVSVRHLIQRPHKLNAEWSSLFRPFPTSIWGLLLAATLLNTLAIAFVTRLINQIDEDFVFKNYANVWWSGYVSLGVLLMSGIPESSERQGPLRHLLNSWVLTCFLLTTCFSSSLVSHLTTPDLGHRPETVQGLVEGGYFWGMNYKPDMSLVLDLSNPWHRMWAERFILVKSEEDHIKLIDNDKFVLWGKSIENLGFFLNEDYLPLEKLSKWEASNEIVSSFYFTFALTPGSQILPAINRYLSLIIETGQVDKYLKDIFTTQGAVYMKEVLIKTKVGGVGAETLTLSNLHGLFYIIVLGLTFAAVAFIIEIICYRKKNQRDN